jgi:hypothetical protein
VKRFHFSLFAAVGGLVLFTATAGCNKPEKTEPSPEKKMLNKLDSDNPDTFLEGVDEADKKYGKTP